MVNKYVVGKAVLDEVRKDTANDLTLFNTKGTSLVKTLYDLGAFSDSELDNALEQAVFNEARVAIKIMKRNHEYADHSCVYPQHLAYAIEKKALSWGELRVVRKHLDHVKTLDEFVKTYRTENVVLSLRDKLLNPKPHEFSGSGDSDIDLEHPACCCGH